MTTVNQLIQEGDWVSGTTRFDEKFIGYVHSVDKVGLKVWVTQSDHEAITGSLVDSILRKVKKLHEFTPETKEDLNGLIEVALMTHDKAWFEMLVGKLNGVMAPAGERPAGHFDNQTINNRLPYGIRSE